jgi:hypothetical protein
MSSSIDTRVEMLETLVESMQKQIALLVKDNKKEKKEKKEKPETKVKRALTGYQLFCKHNRADAIEALNGEGDEKPKQSLILKKLGSMWQEHSDEDKEAWKIKATALKSASSDSEPEIEVKEEAQEVKEKKKKEKKPKKEKNVKPVEVNTEDEE